MAVIVAAGAGLLAHLGGIGAVDRLLYDELATRLPHGPPGSVVLVAIDEASFAEIGLSWPWPRDLHARLVESLREAGARVIAFDILFADPGLGDDAFAAVLGPDVVLAADKVVTEAPQGRIEMLVTPLPRFSETGARSGLVSLPLDPDGAVRSLPPVAGSFAAALLAAVPTPPQDARIAVHPPPGALPRVSYYQALDAARALPPDLFRDRIALVGLHLRASPAMMADAYRTPWTARGGGLMPGVELQARVTTTLARQSWTVPAHPALAPLGALLAAFAAVSAVRRRIAPAAVLIAVLIALFLVALSALLLRAGVWFSPAAPALAALVAGVGQAGLDHARERRARHAITRSFEHYVSPQVVRRLARDPGALRLGGERRRITILFCDLRGFTSLSERMQDDPEGLTALLNRALTVVADAVLSTGGLVDKFIGDCVMGLWNAPFDTPDHAARAVRAGVAAIEGVERLNAELAFEAAAEGRVAPVLACGVGINTGDCVVGNMGSASRFEYTALGDAVNVASRLESLTKALGVPMLVGASTVADLPSGSEGFVELEAAVLKGRAAPVRIFAPERYEASARAARP